MGFGEPLLFGSLLLHSILLVEGEGQRLFLRERLTDVRLRAAFTAGVLEIAKARARSASSVRSRRNGVIDTQLCLTAQRSVPFPAPSNGVTVKHKIERPIGSWLGTTVPS